ncbi:MAG: flavin reductase family protein [Pseudomonadota bacterium]
MASDQAVNSFDEAGFRRALGCFGTGVALVAADDDDGLAHGLTVNSFTSVSLDPPIILWCLDEGSAAYAVFADAETFSVNILCAGSQDVSKRFSMEGDRTLAANEVHRLATGAPVLTGALASFDCHVKWRQKAGDHLVLFGGVDAFERLEEGEGLGYFRGGYTTLSQAG